MLNRPVITDQYWVWCQHILLALTMLVALPGCRNETVNEQVSGGNVTQPVTKELPEQDAQELLRKMEQAYRDAKSYSDRGQVVLRYVERGDIVSDEAPLSVVARLPNRLSVKAYFAHVVCDGTKLLAKITDEQSGDIDGQILHRELRGDLTLEQLYSNSLLREAMTSGMGGQPLQLNLLYSQDPLKSVFAADAKCRFMESKEFDGHLCYRVVSEGAEGEFVFWIDSETWILRRLEYPAEGLLPELAQADFIKDLSLRLEFRDASFEPALDESAFQFDLPADAKQVGAFVLGPQPLPTELFGKKPDSFALYDVNGGQVESKALLGKVAVLIWFNGHPACRSTMKQFGEVYAKQKANDRIQMYAVSTEPSNVSTEQIQDTLASWDVDIPLLRDLDASGRDTLGIPWTPTMIVFDMVGTVQIFEVGANNNLAEELPTILDRLGKGDDLAREILADHEDQEAAYQQTLKAAMQEAGTPVTGDDPATSVPTRGQSIEDADGE